MIKTAQEAYVAGRQAAMEKLAYNVFADSGLNIFDSGIDRTPRVIENSNRKTTNSRLDLLERLKSGLIESRDRNRRFLDYAFIDDLNKIIYKNHTREFDYKSSKEHDGFEPSVKYYNLARSKDRLPIYNDEEGVSYALDTDKILKDYPKAILLDSKDPRNNSKTVKEILFQGESPEKIGDKYISLHPDYEEWVHKDSGRAIEKALEGETMELIPDVPSTLPGRFMSKILPQYKKSLSKLKKNEKETQQLKNKLKDIPPDIHYTEKTYLTPQNINRLAMLAGTGGGSYLGNFTPRAFGVSLAGSVTGNLLGGALGAGINSFTGSESNLVPLLGSTTGAIGGGLASGRYLS